MPLPIPVPTQYAGSVLQKIPGSNNDLLHTLNDIGEVTNFITADGSFVIEGSTFYHNGTRLGFFGQNPTGQQFGGDARHALVAFGLINGVGTGIPNAIQTCVTDWRNGDGSVLDPVGGTGKSSLVVDTVAKTFFAKGEEVRNGTVVNVLLCEFVLPFDYQRFTDLTLTVNARHVENGGTGLTNKLNVHVFKTSLTGGFYGDDVVNVADVVIPATNTDLAFTIPGNYNNAGFIYPGDRLLIQVVSTATETGDTGTTYNRVNSIRVQ